MVVRAGRVTLEFGSRMSLFRTVGFVDPGPVLRGRGVYMRVPTMGDFGVWALLREKSRAFLAPWEPLWPEDDLARVAFRRRVRRYQQEMQDDQGYAFFLFREEDDQLVGGLTLSNMRRGVAQATSLGYWMGAPYAGKGYMTAGVRALQPFVFDTLRLHRLEAACMPTNQPSIRILERTGFKREGFARKYLSIAGRWEDHLLYAMLAEDPRT
jgi:[ribosomal protein S5]-alanine N-acetyltransferase